MSAASGKPIRILHVDDDPAFGEVVATILERESERFAVETATSPERALDRLAGDVDCVVSDYEMPGANGIELLEAVRESYPDLPFILFTFVNEAFVDLTGYDRCHLIGNDPSVFTTAARA